jgi:Flp pilus assembly protein TadG
MAAIRSRLAAFRRDQAGNFAVIFALMSFVLIGVFGIGIDYWSAFNDKTRADAAADAAGLVAVNTAKAFYAANSGTMTGSALSNAAIAAGQAAGQKAFAVNLGSSDMASTITSSVVVAYTNLQFNATVTFSGQTAAHFGSLFGLQTIAVGGASVAVSGLPKYLDFYIVTDFSASMGIPTNATDQQTLIATNPDNAQEKANYPTGCQFACHYSGYQGFTYTQNTGLKLKLNDVGTAISALISTATQTKIIANQFRIGLYGFIDNAVQLASLSSNFGSATTVANSLANYIDNGGGNNGMNAGGTHFENIWNGIHSYFQTPGDGTSSSSTIPFIVIVTDGADNSQTYTASANFSGSWPQLPDTTDTNGFCGTAKAAGYTVAVLLIPYDPIVNPINIWNDEDAAVNYLVDPTTYHAPPSPYKPTVPAGDNLVKNMQACASAGYFFSAATSDAINAAMQTIFYQAVQSTRMTQ